MKGINTTNHRSIPDIVNGSRANNQFFHYRNKTGFMHYTYKNLAK